MAIVGGGTAGWITAAVLARVFRNGTPKVQLVESSQIGTVGVGEATVPPIVAFIKFLGIDEREFIQATQASFKLAIKFADWKRIGHSYWHPFGAIGVNIDDIPFYPFWLKSSLDNGQLAYTDYSPAICMASRDSFFPPASAKNSLLAGASYAWHFDANLVARYLRAYSEERGVERVDAKVTDVTLTDDGRIGKLRLDNGAEVEADLYVDCSGFRGLLIEGALQTGYVDWTNYLPCDRAVALPSTKSDGMPPYTLATARPHGWQWRIPLQHRTGNGYVYCSEHCTDEEAADLMTDSLGSNALGEPRFLRFVAGHRRTMWNKNCVAIGLSAGFLEPLESTSIHMIMRGVRRLIELFPDRNESGALADEYNTSLLSEFEAIRDFLVLHYAPTERNDSEFWKACQALPIPDSLAAKLELFRESGRLSRNPADFFSELSWQSVLEGMEIRPRTYDPLADTVEFSKVKSAMKQVKSSLDDLVSRTPSHADFLKSNCAAPIPGE